MASPIRLAGQSLIQAYLEIVEPRVPEPVVPLRFKIGAPDDVEKFVLSAMPGVRLQPVETLSKGFKRRVGLAQALLHDPPVLVLDEPTDGLDPNQKHEVRTLIAQMAPRKAIVISTHILEEVDAVCTRAIIIAAGRVVADATPAELQRRHPSGKLDDVFRQLTMDAA